jgi:putative nucleotidyltransferase with HDIG domain
MISEERNWGPEMGIGTEQRIRIEQVRPGMFIRLFEGWLEHPFLFNQFKLKNWNQVETLRNIGVREVSWVPEKSDCLPKRAEEPETAGPLPVGRKGGDPYVEMLWQVKKERLERLRQKHQSLRQCSLDFKRTIGTVPNLMEGMLVGSEEALINASKTVMDMADVFLGDTDAIVHFINIKDKDESIYNHSLNVSVLALLLGRKVRLTPDEMHELGMGALFHDIGKNRIEKKVLKKTGPLTRAELDLIQLHPQYGAEILTPKGVPQGVLRVVLEHHEDYNGQGYPSGLEGENISTLARIVRIVDMYDNLCNNPDQGKCMTPYEALSYMFTKRQNHLDMDMFSEFIRCMGIYPPGTVVQLSNGEVGIVISINPENPLKPSLLLYDPNIPKDEALILDMEDDMDIAVEKSIPVERLADEVRLYLNLSRHVTYFVERGKRKEK